MTDISTCRVCGNRPKLLFEGVILGRYPTAYYQCTVCGYLQTGTPTWLDEAYGAAVTTIDTGLISRNLAFARVVATFLILTGNTSGPFLDYAGGYGVFTRLMRDTGFDFYHQDRYAPNLHARGFEWDDSLGRPAACTALEVLEHLTEPVQGLEEMSRLGPEFIITSTELLPDGPLKDWWYLAPESGQHIGFFEPRTMRHLATTIGYPHVLISDRIQVISKNPVSRAAWAASVRLGRYLFPLLKRRLSSLTESDSELLRIRLREDSSEH